MKKIKENKKINKKKREIRRKKEIKRGCDSLLVAMFQRLSFVGPATKVP